MNELTKVFILNEDDKYITDESSKRLFYYTSSEPPKTVYSQITRPKTEYDDA